MQLQKDISLKSFNTFGIDVPAEYTLHITREAQLPEITADGSMPQARHILGGGSNVLFTKPVTGVLLLNRLKGIDIVNESEAHVWVKVMAGEVWHSLVMMAIDKGWGGIENLALIPGTAGAAPMQNIGAYGAEAKETIERVTAWHWEDRAFITLQNADCQFGYRDSIFKRELKEKVFITSVIFRLNKQHHYNVAYGAIKQELERAGVQRLSIKAIADAVIAIRTSKLPDPRQIGNAGSFFKNPTISATQFDLLQSQNPDIPHYKAEDNMVKIPAGWLIEQCGWKGYRKDDYGVHAKQALVLVNYGNASGKEILQLSEQIIGSVNDRFGIVLEREVQIW